MSLVGFSCTPQRTHAQSFFDVLRSSTESQGLRDILLRDTASRIAESDADSFKLVMHNLSLFIEKVHTGAYDPGLVRREFRLQIFAGPLIPQQT
jgi:hypothetical protein